MDLKQLRTFRAVAELGSLSKAADRLRAAQPALSRHIKLLEHELRVELFIRNGRGMLLTNAGRMLLDRTTGLVRQIEQVRDDIQSASGSPSGRVILGPVPTVSAVLSGRFARRFPPDLAAHRRKLWRPSGCGSGDHVRSRGGSTSLGSLDRARRHCRCRPAGFRLEQEKTGRSEVARETKSYPSECFTRLAGGKSRSARKTDAQRHDRGRF